MGKGLIIKIILALIILIFIFIPFCKGFLGALPDEETSESDVPNGGVETKEEDKPIKEMLKISAFDLATDYDANEVKADETYKNKNLEVTGTVSSIQKDIFDKIQVTLMTDNMFIDVIGYVEDSEKDKVMELTTGDTVTMDCVGGGKLVFVVLKDCMLK